MIKAHRWFLGFWLALVLTLSLTPQAGAACSLKVGWEPYVPYQFVGEDGVVTGADIELTHQVGQRLDCQVEFSQQPWARQLSELRNGSLDVAMSASWSEERNGYVHFSIPYRRSEKGIFVRKGTAADYPFNSLSEIVDLKFRLGVIFGYYYGGTFENLLDNPDFAALVDPAPDYLTNIRKLLHKRIDGVLSDDLAVMRAEARSLGVEEQIERHPLWMAGDEFHFMFSRRSVPKDIVSAFDQQLAVMQSNGDLDAIMQSFIK